MGEDPGTDLGHGEGVDWECLGIIPRKEGRSTKNLIPQVLNIPTNLNVPSNKLTLDFMRHRRLQVPHRC